MSLLSNNGSRPDYQNTEVQDWEVYSDRSERLGRVVDTLVDRTGALQFFVVALDSGMANQQILLPATDTQIDSQSQRVYLHGVSLTDIINSPRYPHAQRDRTATNRSTEVTSLEASGALESQTPLEGWSQERGVAPSPPVATPAKQTPVFVETPTNIQLPEELEAVSTRPQPEIVERETIQLLEERLAVTSNRRKIGDVIVRKVVETQIIEVPVRREKLIVEQISPESKTLAVVDLGEGHSNSVELAEMAHSLSTQPSASGEFRSASSASQFLAAIARQPNATYDNIEVRINLDNPKLKAVYQKWIQKFLASEFSQSEGIEDITFEA